MIAVWDNVIIMIIDKRIDKNGLVFFSTTKVIQLSRVVADASLLPNSPSLSDSTDQSTDQ